MFILNQARTYSSMPDDLELDWNIICECNFNFKSLLDFESEN